MMKFCEVALLLFAALAPDGGAVARTAVPTTALRANPQIKDGTAVADLANVADMNARDVYSANGERIGELSEVVLNHAHRPVAASIETDERDGGSEHVVSAQRLRLQGPRLVTDLTRQQVEAMPRAND